MKILTRMGDSSSVELTRDELRQEFIEGSELAAKKGKIPALTENEIDYLVDMFAAPTRIWGVQRGHEVVMTKDGCVNALNSSRMSSGVVAPVNREVGVRLFESMLGFDSMEVAHNDYSVKPQRFLKALEQLHMEILQEVTIFPLFYGFMPNLGLYYRPDGSFENPSDLLPLNKIAEARATQEEALEKCLEDCVEMSDCMVEMGADGIDYDTTASTGDAEFLAVLRTTEHVANETGLPVEIGMAAEMVLGFHGELEYNGKRLAGMWPHQQLKVVEEAGGAIFGPVVNTNTRKTVPWNLGRALTFVKACTEIAKIPVHPNVGMGVGGVPMFETPAVDAVTRCSAAMIEIGHADGL
jgi:dimethylamine---corrinoid protein Co-methyltransferase